MATHVPVLIVGAGISGLVCAYALRKSGVATLIVESSSRPGGMLRSERRDGYLLELGPQSFTSTPQLFELCGELGIAKELVAAPPRAPRFLVISGKLKRVPLTPPALIGSSLLGLRTKWSILRDPLGRSTPPDEDESVAAFTRRKFTPEVLDKLVGPFVSGIYAGDPEKLSLRAAFPQLHEAERAAGSVVRGLARAAKAKAAAGGKRKRPTLQAFRDGNETLAKAVAARLGSALRCGAAVTEICKASSHSGARFEVVVAANGSSEKVGVDNIVFAAPSNATGQLLSALQPQAASALSAIEYVPVVVVSLGYQESMIGHSLNGFGFLIPRSEKLRTLGTVWNSSLFPNRAPEGHVLFTSFVGGATDPEAAALAPDVLVSLVHKEISSLLQIQAAPSFSNVTLYPRALPQYNLGHLERLAAIEQVRKELPGVWVTGNFLRGPSIGTCIEEALAVADEIHARVSVKDDRSP